MTEEQRPVEASCDECGATFEVAFRDEPQHDEGVKIVFGCPECGHIYEVAYLPKRAVELRREIAFLRRQASTAKNHRRLNEALAEYQGLYVGLASQAKSEGT